MGNSIQVNNFINFVKHVDFILLKNTLFPSSPQKKNTKKTKISAHLTSNLLIVRTVDSPKQTCLFIIKQLIFSPVLLWFKIYSHGPCGSAKITVVL